MWRVVKAELAYSWWQILGLLTLCALPVSFVIRNKGQDLTLDELQINLFVLWFLMPSGIFITNFLKREVNESRLKLISSLPITRSRIFLSRAITSSIVQLFASTLAVIFCAQLTVNGAQISLWLILSGTLLGLFGLYFQMIFHELQFMSLIRNIVGRIILIVIYIGILFPLIFDDSTRPAVWRLLTQPLGAVICTLLALGTGAVAHGVFIRRKSYLGRG